MCTCSLLGLAILKWMPINYRHHYYIACINFLLVKSRKKYRHNNLSLLLKQIVPLTVTGSSTGSLRMKTLRALLHKYLWIIVGTLLIPPIFTIPDFKKKNLGNQKSPWKRCQICNQRIFKTNPPSPRSPALHHQCQSPPPSDCRNKVLLP